MINRVTFRLLCIVGGSVSLLILIMAYVLEYGFNLAPCSLCLLQRYALWAAAFSFWIGAIFSTKTFLRVASSFSAILFNLLGFYLAGRHVWMRFLPSDQLASCSAGLQTLLKYKPIWEALSEVFTSHECSAQLNTAFLGLSLPMWSLLSFSGLLLFSVVIFILQIKRRI